MNALWRVMMCIDELWLFLQGPPSQDCEAQDEGGHQMEIVVRPAAYCRADLCEVKLAINVVQCNL